MKIDITNLGVIEKKVKARIEPMWKAFQKAVETEKEVIRSRTLQGIDVNGDGFKPYSPKNPGRNWAAVRKRNNRPTGYVDLNFTGTMLKAMKVSFKRDGFKFLATIYFSDRKQSKKAQGHNSGQLGPTKFEPRKFFGLSQAQRETIMSKIRNAR